VVLSLLDKIAVSIAKTRSVLFSMLGGGLASASVSILTSLIYSTSLMSDLSWSLLSSFLMLLAAISSSILSWRMDDIQHAVESSARALGLQTEGERWEYAIKGKREAHEKKRSTIYGKIRSTIYYLTLTVVFTMLGILVIIIHVGRFM